MAENQRGFTLIELMIVIAIIGILASIAIPQYTDYSKRSKFSEVVMATTAFKSPAEIAVQTGRATALTDLDAGAFGIPVAITDLTAVGEHVAGVDMEDGVITATGAASVDGATFTLTPTLTNGGLTWTQDGSCLTDGLC